MTVRKPQKPRSAKIHMSSTLRPYRRALSAAPATPNLADITTVDWSTVEPVDVLTGGFPCQDVSTAGRRAGLAPGTRSGLWSHMAHAISVLRPRLVIAENVRGLLSAPAHSDMEPCPWCLGDSGDVAALRAFGCRYADRRVMSPDAASSSGCRTQRKQPVHIIQIPRCWTSRQRGECQSTEVAGGRACLARRPQSHFHHVDVT
ncbi:DNA cytosine methyltransferase [Prauserella cavernicola]|uniref:DNA cytosine methyltransferase n=1 Tax=Prauserella cavernicola TaxID=2800127 RepID=A0A934V5S9_9PSEU|nr:DNA cytosine methyltransferase [Prauserella cavernicola]MBK1785994.1 DNA cytosine methyltransferase [Prauserella cavernicola]